MRWKNRGGPTEFLSEKTFLVIKDNLQNVFDISASTGSTNDNFYMKKKSQEICTPRSIKPKSGSSNAGTWPPKVKKKSSKSSTNNSSTTSLERPKTANLEEPNFLDPRLIDKLDMSMLSKELLLDSMTHIQLINNRGVGVDVGGIERRRQSLNIPSCPGGGSSSSRSRRRETCNRLDSRTSATRLLLQGFNNHHNESSNSGIISLARQKRKSFEPVTDSETYYNLRDTSPGVRSTMKKQLSLKNPQGVVGCSEKISKRSNNNNNNNNTEVIRNRDDINNNKRISAAGGNLTPKISALTMIPKKKASKTSIKSDVEVFTGPTKAAPEPCKTCGRSDQPERFHSHPKNAGVTVKVRVDNGNANSAKTKTMIAVPKSIQKPVALNFRSEKSKGSIKTDQAPTSAVIGASKNASQDTQGNVIRKERPSPQSANSSPKRGPRSVTCYICSREFGTASFPIHEPKCLQKWERENSALPPSQRRPAPPQRPEVMPGHQGWNKAAWEQSQAQLLPCSRCGRTFLPDRLPVHEKSCKTQKIKNPVQKEEPEQKIRLERSNGPAQGAGSGTSVSREPPMVFCQICGRSFGSRSIKIHEPQCLKRWQSENEGLPAPAPQRKKDPATPPSINSSMLLQQETLQQIPQKKTIPCYICGRDFGSTSISIHEPQCLRKWHQENDKLPPGQRRQQPEKPDIVFTRDGTGAEVIDHVATAEANWQSHLGQLVPCKKCGRTFNPDRVAVHERGCKGKR